MAPRFTARRPVRVVAAAIALGVLTTAAVPTVVRVRRGDTLWALARRYHTSVAALRALNHLPGNNVIREGELLRLRRPPAVGRARTAAPTRRVRVVERGYVVQAGDGVIRIARRFRAEPDWIAHRNRLPRSRIVRIGQRLVVPVRVVATVPPPAKPTSAPDRVPVKTVMALIRTEARRAHIDPNLALGLAWQESGFKMHKVSAAGAVGAMQVLPSTGRWVSRYVVHRPLDLRNARDNVIAGVRYLAVLLRVARKPDLAIAGYYQGLASVRQRGMLAVTRRYVANVLALRRRFAART
ncbi:MAG: LysM peptidoglycan-binding domain-containing protein [Mycobacteriales bacterium]